MREVLERILNQYLNEKKKEVKDSELWDFIAKQRCIKNFYGTGIIDKSVYFVKSSAGQGRWGNVPWIGIFDKEIGITAKKGYYIVYLFSADMKKVYLSLNQGWSYFRDTCGGVKKGREKIKKVTAIWKHTLCTGGEAFSFDDIKLEYQGVSDLPEGYELGHICGKCYYADDLPDEEILVRDLQNLLTVFRELKGNMIDKSTEKTNNHLLAEFESGAIEKLEEKKSAQSKEIDQVIASEAQNSYLCKSDELPEVFIDSVETSNMRLQTRSINYVLKAEKQGKLGLAGELMVIEYEKRKLKELNINKQVEHISKITKDQAGYDIKSYDENGNEIHIEVKTTRLGINTPFYLSHKELEYCNKNEDKYRLYRIYNFNDETQTGDFYIIEGRIDNFIHLQPYTYIAQGRVTE